MHLAQGKQLLCKYATHMLARARHVDAGCIQTNANMLTRTVSFPQHACIRACYTDTCKHYLHRQRQTLNCRKIMRSKRYERDRERSGTVAALQTKAPHLPPRRERGLPALQQYYNDQQATRAQSPGQIMVCLFLSKYDYAMPKLFSANFIEFAILWLRQACAVSFISLQIHQV